MSSAADPRDVERYRQGMTRRGDSPSPAENEREDAGTFVVDCWDGKEDGVLQITYLLRGILQPGESEREDIYV